MEEPSVLDYVKSKLYFWKGPGLKLPAEQPAEEEVAQQSAPSTPRASMAQVEAAPALAKVSVQIELEPSQTASGGAEVALQEVAPILEEETPVAGEKAALPWRSLAALGLALAAQYSFGPGPERTYTSGLILLAAAIVCLLWAIMHGEWELTPLPQASLEIDPASYSLTYLAAGMFVALIAFITFGGLRFSPLNLSLLLIALGLTMRAFWIPAREPRRLLERLAGWLKRPRWSFAISLTTIAALAAIGWVFFFRFYRLAQVPPEMNSDHAEKILDVLRVLNGSGNIFFPTNGGREALQMYLVAGVHKFLGIELGFTALKLVTVTVGFLALPFIYLIGKELGSRRIGLLAFLFAGVAYWPNVVSRFGLRLPFYILFTSALIYFLLRGIRTSRRNDFLYSGIVLGLSFYGYSADRILPLLVIVAVGLYLLHPQSALRRQHTLISTVGLIIISFVIFLPMLRYMLAEPDAFLYRTLSRMGGIERPIDAPVLQIFLKNLAKALAMFSWSDGEVWPISIPHYPALGIVAGGLFYLGVILVFLRYLRNRHWLDLFLLVSIPVLLLPSVLSLAFPDENPNLYRTGGALVPVFLIIAVALDGWMVTIARRLAHPWGRRIAWGTALLLIAWASWQDYDLVFNQYHQQYLRSAWNSSEMGQVARDFVESLGSAETVWVVGHPHWVDTRLVAANAGFPGKDFELKVENLESTLQLPGAKLFIVNPQAVETIDRLGQLYPQGWFHPFRSKVETKDFLIFVVPPSSGTLNETQ